MSRLERKFLAHYIDVGMNSDYTNYVRLGKDLEEYKEELNPQINVQRDLKGEPCARVGGYQVQSEVEYYYAYQGEVLFDVLSDIANKRLNDSSCRTTKVDLLVDSKGRQIWAYREDCLLVPASVGGDTSGIQIPFTLVNAGNRTYGVYNRELNEFIPSDEPAKPGAIAPLRIYANGEYVAAQGCGYSPVVVDIGGGQGEEYALVLVDWNGDTVRKYTYDELRVLESLPANTSRLGFTSSGWNWTLNEIKRWCLDARGFTAYVGQYYAPDDFDVRVVLDLPSGLLSPIIRLKYQGTIDIDWGDSTVERKTSPSDYVANSYSHTYSVSGEYTIKIKRINKDYGFALYATSTGSVAPFICSSSYGGADYSGHIKSLDVGDVTGMSSALSFCQNIDGVSLSKYPVSDDAFRYCSSLSGFVFPSVGNSNEVQLGMFRYCASLKTVALGEQIVSIGANAFEGCVKMEEISFPRGLTSIGGYSFRNCLSLKRVFFPSAVATIGIYAFSQCRSIAKIAFGGTVSTIGEYAFERCDLSDGKIVVDASSIGSYAFQYTGMKEVELSSSLTSIGSYAFSNCFGLKKVTIGQSATYTLGSSAFQNDYSLESISMGGVTSIGGYGFYQCYSLVISELPSGLETISGYAFYMCLAIEELTIPSSVTSIGGSAFASCGSLSKVHFLGTTPPTFGTGVFSTPTSNYQTPTIYVPYSADHSVLAAYKAATNFVVYEDYIMEEPQ